MNLVNDKDNVFYDFDLDLLNDTLDDSYNNDSFCILQETSPNDFDVVTLPESVPGEQLLKFIEYLYDTDKIDKDYLRKETIPNPSENDISNMSYEDVLTQITVILRGDRFCSGMLYSSIKCGTFLNLLERLKEILTEGDDFVPYNDEEFEEIVSEVVKKIEGMEEGESASIEALVNGKTNIDLYYVFEEVDKRLRRENIILDYSRFENQIVGSMENLPFIKRGKKKTSKLETNKYSLKVEYTPFNNLSESKEPIITTISLDETGDIKINGVVLKIIKVDDKELKFILPEGQGVYCKMAYKNRPITLRVNDRVVINSEVKDCPEIWRITFLNKDVPEKEWAKCPLCGGELQEYIYGETTFGLPDGKIAGGCVIRRDNPNYRCPRCGKDFKRSEVMPNKVNIKKSVNVESRTEKSLDDKDELILFKITNKDKIYDFTFGVHDQNSWLDFSIDNDPKMMYDCNLSEYLYEDFSKRIDEFTSNWKNSYKKESESNINWNLCKISHGKVIKNYVGINDYPDNWNEFLDYIIMFEKISKMYSNKRER